MRHSPVDGDHNLILQSPNPPPLTSFEPSGAHSTHRTEPLWPSSVFKHSPVDGFQIFTNLSSLPLASSPAIDHATVLT